jgi:hypothetical protein
MQANMKAHTAATLKAIASAFSTTEIRKQNNPAAIYSSRMSNV